LKPAYSYRWANEVIQRLHRKHARATEIFCRMYQITLRDLAHYLAIGDSFYVYARERIKKISQRNERLGKEITLTDLYDWELYYPVRFRPPGLQERLTKRLRGLILQEQVSKGIPGGLRPDGNRPSDSEFPSEVIENGKVQYCLPFGLK
jgi:hypothetical protein